MVIGTAVDELLLQYAIRHSLTSFLLESLRVPTDKALPVGDSTEILTSYPCTARQCGTSVDEFFRNLVWILRCVIHDLVLVDLVNHTVDSY